MTFTVEYVNIAEQLDRYLTEPARDETQQEEEKWIKIRYEQWQKKTVTFPSQEAYVLWMLRWS